MFIVRMHSDEFGTEQFKYESLTEALEGLERLNRKCIELNDGIVREFNLEKV